MPVVNDNFRTEAAIGVSNQPAERARTPIVCRKMTTAIYIMEITVSIFRRNLADCQVRRGCRAGNRVPPQPPSRPAATVSITSRTRSPKPRARSITSSSSTVRISRSRTTTRPFTITVVTSLPRAAYTRWEYTR